MVGSLVEILDSHLCCMILSQEIGQRMQHLHSVPEFGLICFFASYMSCCRCSIETRDPIHNLQLQLDHCIPHFAICIRHCTRMQDYLQDHPQDTQSMSWRYDHRN